MRGRLRSPSPHARRLRTLGLPPGAVAPLASYLDLLAAWSLRVNLTGARTAEERVALLVEDVLPAAPFLEPGRLVDVGSGNGSPGLVLACLRPDLPVTLLEPRSRRWAFLREAARRMGRGDIEVLRERSEGYAGPRARTLTLRGLRLPPAELARLVEEAGRVLLFGGEGIEGGPFAREAEVDLPRGRLHVLRREGSTWNT